MLDSIINNRELKKTKTVTAKGTSLDKSFTELCKCVINFMASSAKQRRKMIKLGAV